MSDTQTTELPPLTEAMTARDLRAHQDAMQAMLGVQYHVSIDAGSRHMPQSCCSVYISGHLGGSQFFRAGDWPAAIREARQWIANHAVVRRNTLVRRMAMALIDIKDEFGAVTESDLERRQFSRDDIREFGVAACERAGEMAAGAPFEIVP